MTNVAQGVAIETTQHQTFPDGSMDPMSTPTKSTENLVLDPNPTTSYPTVLPVYVYTFAGSSQVAGFSLSSSTLPSNTFYTGGLVWNFYSSGPNAVYSMFVTFVFLSSTPANTEISCQNLSYSDLYAGGTNQMLCIPPSANTYTFSVNFGNGNKHDPQIVVTPITGGNDDH